MICLSLLVLTGACVPAQKNESASVLTLEEAITEAQHNNRLIKIAAESVLSANDDILAAKTQRYPQFNVQLMASGLLTAVNVNIPEGVFGNVGGTPVPNTNSVVTTQPKFSGMSVIEAYQPLTQLWSAHLNIQLLKVGKKLTEEQLRQQKQQITNSVKEAYYSLLQTQSSLEAAGENLKALQEVDRTTEQYVQEKTALGYQSAGIKAQVAQAELQQITLEDTYETQKENLNNLMGRDITTDFRLSPVPEALPEEQDLQQSRQRALAKRTEVHQAQFKIEQAVYARRLQKAQYIPEIGIQYLYFSPFSIEGLPQNINSLGVSFKWNLFDWGYKKHLLDEKQHGIEQSQLNLLETNNQVLIDLDNRFRKLREARAALKVSQLGMEAEKQKLQVTLEQYKQKAVLLSVLQTEQANMAQATAQYQQALSAFWSARAEFEKSLGED
ncbi:MAG: TolC family protein [Candidatus Acidiferrum sp.]